MQGRRRAFGLDVVRVLAALGVVVTHVAFATGVVNPDRFPSSLRLVLPRLDVGVSVFFVLSGLLVGRPFVRAVLGDAPRPGTPAYLRRRLTRIYPVYWFVLAVVVLSAPTLGRSAVEMVADVLLLHPYRPAWAIGPISQSWTLTTELAFYLLLPAWCALAVRSADRRGLDRGGRVRLVAVGLAGWVLAALVWRTGVVALTDRYEFGRPGLVDVRGALLTWLPNHLDTFALGVGTALWLESGRARPLRLAARLGSWAVAAVALWAASAWIGLPPVYSGFDGPQTHLRHLLFAVVAVGVVLPSAAATLGRPAATGLATRGEGWAPPAWASSVAGAAALGSYGVYLWHQWVTTEWFRLEGLAEFVAPFPTAMVVVVAASTVLAAGSYWLVERPAELVVTGRGGSPAAPPRALGPVPALDGLRGLAILAVLATHVVFLDGGDDRFALRGGFLGVDVFLALSGALIGLVLLREVDATGGVDLGGFARRRARRLLPPLVAFLAVEGAVAVWLVGTPAREQGLQSVLSLTFTSNWQLTFGHQPPFALVHLWSLALEGQFYVLLALLVLAVRRRVDRPDRLVAWCVLGAAAVLVWRLVLLRGGAELPALYERTDARLDSMLLGLAAALVWRSRLWERAGRPRRRTSAAPAEGGSAGGSEGGSAGGSAGGHLAGGPVVAGAALVLLGVCAVVAAPGHTWLFRGGFTAVAAAASVVVLGALATDGPVRRLAKLRPLRWVGGISFSLYLWHLPVYLWVVELLPGAPVGLKVAVAVPASFVAGWLGHVLVERRVLATWRRSPAS